MRTLLLIAIFFAAAITVVGVQSFTPSLVSAASAQNEEVVEVEEGEVEDEGEPEEETEEDSGYDAGSN